MQRRRGPRRHARNGRAHRSPLHDGPQWLRRVGFFRGHGARRCSGSRGRPSTAFVSAYVHGASARDVGRITEALMGEQVGRSTVSRVTKSLNDKSRIAGAPRSASPIPYLFLDATSIKGPRPRRSPRPRGRNHPRAGCHDGHERDERPPDDGRGPRTGSRRLRALRQRFAIDRSWLVSFGWSIMERPPGDLSRRSVSGPAAAHLK